MHGERPVEEGRSPLGGEIEFGIVIRHREIAESGGKRTEQFWQKSRPRWSMMMMIEKTREFGRFHLAGLTCDRSKMAEEGG